MTIEWLRDLIIIIFGVIGIGTSVFFVVIGYSLFKRITRVLETMNEALKALESVSSLVNRPVSQPINMLVNLVNDVRDGIESVSKMFQRGS